MPHRPWPFLLVAISVLLFACSNSPTTSNNTEPIADARTSFKSSDFSAALRNLDKAIKIAPDDATRQQTIELRTALVTALADANKQMAEAATTSEQNSRPPRHTPGRFMKSALTSTRPPKAT